jgi:GT2 family glycosyltransferase
MSVDPEISVVIPVGNGSTKLRTALRALAGSEGVHHEVILVGDRVKDDSLSAAAGFRFCIVAKLDGTGGVSAARNRGAELAKAPIIVFIDSDIEVQPETLSKIVSRINSGEVDGVVGLLSTELPYDNFASQLKNLWMRWTYERLTDRIALFYTSLAAIRTELFRKSGGFDVRYKAPSIEDTLLGGTLMEMGARIELARDIQVVHHKQYSLNSLLRTDFARSIALTRFTLRDKFKRLRGHNTTAVPTAFIIHLFMVPLALAAMVLGVVANGLWWLAALALIGLMWLCNLSFLRYLLRQRGAGFMLRAALFMLPQAAICFLGASWGVVGYPLGRKY